MLKFLKNIARGAIVGFLLISVSGLTIAIHHEHIIGDGVNDQGHNQHDRLSVNAVPSTYHEIHVVKLVSGDSFNASQKIECKTSFVQLFAVHLDRSDFAPLDRSISLTNNDIKHTGPPSVDKCVLFCSFLI